jgi:EAL domain-containing protein (putative c-di-GMP-specific phosphodiesterase class I)
LSIKNAIKEGKFFHHFQPIKSLNCGERLGYEVLLRSEYYTNPEIIFKEAIEEDVLYALDSHSLYKGISTFVAEGFVRGEGKLFLNVLPSTILNPEFLSFISQSVEEKLLDRQDIVLEISETEIIEQLEEFMEKIVELKKAGFMIAIDDIGNGYSNLKTIIELNPNFLKLDRYFSKNLSLSTQKQAIITFLLAYCKQQESQLILEGIENKEDMEIAKALGVPIVQGYYLGKPSLLTRGSQG